MSEKGKRFFVSLSIAAIVAAGSPSLHGSSLADVYQNATGAGSWTDPGSGKHYFYGGNYTFKFKNTNSYTPWMQYSPPRVKIGCSGMSLNGGFLGLLGLDDIKLQLENAGALFAWGIMTSLEYTMPGIAAVFEKLQQWSRTIQGLMQNACQAGRAKSMESGFPQAVSGVLDSVTGDGFSALKDWSDGLASKMDAIERKVVDGNVSNTGAKEKVGRYLENGGSVSMLAMYFGQYMPDSMSKGMALGHLSDLYGSRNIGGVALTGIGTEWDRKVLLSKLTFLVFGDLALNKEGMGKMTSLFDSAGNVDPDQVAAFIKATVTGVGESVSAGLIPVPPVIGAEDAARVLLYGIKDIDSPQCGTGYCDIPDYKIAYFNFMASYPSKGAAVDSSGSSVAVDSNTTILDQARIKGLVLTKEAASSSSTSTRIEWDGFYEEGLSAIRYLVYRGTGLGGSYGWYGTNDSSVNLSLVKAPLLLPNVSKYINTIATLEKKWGGENGYTMHLKEQLARVNAHFAALTMAQSLYSLVLQMEGDPNTTLSPEAATALNEYHKQLRAISDDIVAAVRKDMENDNELNDLIEQYKMIDEQINKTLLNVPGAR